MKYLIFTIFFLSVSFLSAKIQLPNIIADNMVLQQQSNVKLWGKAIPNVQIVIKPSWNDEIYKTQSDQDGKWLFSLPTPSAGGPYNISISDGEELILKNILLGEVWFCSGQSNMVMPMKGFEGQPIEGSNKIIARAKKSTPIRMFITDEDQYSNTPLDDIVGSWGENTPEFVSECSAAAYYFAENIHEALDIPVGLVISAKGGSKIEA